MAKLGLRNDKVLSLKDLAQARLLPSLCVPCLALGPSLPAEPGQIKGQQAPAPNCQPTLLTEQMPTGLIPPLSDRNNPTSRGNCAHPVQSAGPGVQNCQFEALPDA